VLVGWLVTTPSPRAVAQKPIFFSFFLNKK
jgi:hypothetical protein